ncbi:MAG: hypothetical protein GY940_13695 [bacterium]|nr:hypothetical protein [bacterium]
MKRKLTHRIVTTFMMIMFTAALMSVPAQAQAGNGDAASFDFWVGKWDLTWTDQGGKVATGKNSIKKILKNKVIREKFKALTGTLKGYRGKSWSVFNPVTKTWKQTWVDSLGAYLEFTGKVDGKNRMFAREYINSKKQKVSQRMLFYNITKNEFDWDWQSSLDGGKTWKLQWRLHYKRQPKKEKKDKKGKKKKKKKKKKESEGN